MSTNSPPPPNVPPSSRPPGGEPQSAGVDVGEAFRWAWKKFQENTATLIVGTLVLAVAAGVVYFVAALITNSLFITDASFNSKTLEITKGSGFLTRLFVSSLTSAVASIAVYLFEANLIHTSLKITDGEKPEVGELFKFEKVNTTLVAAALLAAGTFVGTLLFYLPGLIFSIGASYTLYFLIDKGHEPVESIKQSFSFVINNIGTLIIVILASIAAIIVGAIACGVGLLIAIPVVILVNARVFRQLTGGHIAA